MGVYLCIYMYAHVYVCKHKHMWSIKWDEFQVMWDESHPHALKVAIGKAWDVQDEGAIQEDWENSHQYI